jgi:hypothetical protein
VEHELQMTKTKEVAQFQILKLLTGTVTQRNAEIRENLKVDETGKEIRLLALYMYHVADKRVIFPSTLYPGWYRALKTYVFIVLSYLCYINHP